MDAQVWETLKRSLQNKQLYIQDLPRGPVILSGSLLPKTIPLDVKIVLVDNYATFALLQNHNAKFNKIFFGRPSRITAEIFMGERSIVNIEREVKNEWSHT